jgi:uncharacterized membrane protein (UPF0127 family)
MVISHKYNHGFLSIVLCCSAIFLIACGEKKSEQLIQDTVRFNKEGSVTIVSSAGDTLKSTLEIEFAETDYEIQTGLMYRDKMENNQGMLFVFKQEAPHSFYMKNTLIPLDLLFIRSDSTIARIAKNARPLDESSIPSGEPIQFVLEIKAGMSTAWGLNSNDRIAALKRN